MTGGLDETCLDDRSQANNAPLLQAVQIIA